MDDTTERDLRDLLDRDRVVTLMNRYFASVDEGAGLDADWARTIFTEDVRVAHRGIVLEGLEEIAAGHAFVRDGWQRTIHFATNPRVEVDGDRAHLDGRLLAIHLHRDGNPLDPYIIANMFDADAVRTGGSWRFCRLEQQTVWTSGRSHLDIATGEG